MPVVTCASCGGTTNSAVSDYWDHLATGQAQGCYVRYEQEQWVQGCRFLDAPPWMKPTFNRMIADGRNWGQSAPPDERAEINCDRHHMNLKDQSGSTTPR